MRLLKLYNQASQSFFQPAQLVFFARKKDDDKGKTPQTPQTPAAPTIEEQEAQATAERVTQATKSRSLKDIPSEFSNYLDFNKAGANTYAKEIGQHYLADNIHGEVLKQVAQFLKDVFPKLGDEKQKEVGWFMKALGTGKFPNQAKNAIHFLNAIRSPSEKEHEEARIFLRRLSSDSTGPMTTDREKEILKKFTDLRESDIEHQTVSEVSGKAKTLAETAGIHEALQRGAEVQPVSHWQIEKVPEGLKEKLREIAIQRNAMMKEASAKRDELKTISAMRAQSASAVPSGRQAQRSELLKKEIDRLDKKIDQLRREMEPHLEEMDDYKARQLARFRALNYFFERAGVDVRTAERIRLWFLNLSRSADKDTDLAKAKLKLGVTVDPATGRTHKEETTIEIVGLRFDDEKAPNDYVEPEAPGKLMIQYVDEEGKKCEASYRNFIDLINTFEGYEEIDSLEEMNLRIGEETGYKELAPGQKFKCEVAIDADNEGKAKKEPVEFTIESIDEEKGIITLDKAIKKTGKETMPDSVDNVLYFDRYQKEFKYGEFLKLIKQPQHRFRREAHIDETAEMCAKARQAHLDQCQEYVKDYSEEDKKDFELIGGMETVTLTVPEQNQSQEVLFTDNSGYLHWGALSRRRFENGQEAFYLEENIKKARGTQFSSEDLRRAGVPSRLIGTHFATQPLIELKEASRKINPLELVSLFRNGHITNAPDTIQLPTEADKPPKWTVAQQPYAVAAFESPDKHAFGAAGGAAAAGGSTTAGVLHPTGAETEAPLTKHPEGQEAHPADHDTHAADHADHPAHDAHAADHGAHDEAHLAHDGHKKVPYREDALPYDKIYKYGGMSQPEGSWLKSLWTNTRFMSTNDLWQMGKSMWEYYDKRFERRQKDKYARIGEEIPYFAPEMRRIIEATEHEAVHAFQEAFNYKGVFEIKQRMRATRNKDELKATIEVLSEKGEWRLDDIEFWKCLNRFVRPEYAIPIPSNGDPYTKKGPKDPRTGMDFLKGALDSLWGEGNYNKWYQKNKSAHDSNAKNYYQEGDELESIEGGHERRLSELLKMHKQGLYVNPHEYEGLILHSIENGKSNMQAKVYYMVEGVAAANHNGDTILPFERIAHMSGKVLPKFPIMEYMTSTLDVVRGPDGKKSHKFTLEDYKSWIHTFDDGHPGDPGKNRPGKAVDEFFWKYVLPSEDTLNRINKVARNIEQLDHDDMFAYVPPLDYEGITQICGASTGNKKYLTSEAYANVFPGFSQYMRTLAAVGKKDWLKESIKSYVRFEGIMTGRFERGNKQLTRLTNRTLKSPTIVSEESPLDHINQMNETIKKIIAAYNDETLNDLAHVIYETPEIDIDIKGGTEEQRKVDSAFKNFNKAFDKAVKSDNGQKMMAIITNTNLFGMPFKNPEEKARRKAMLVTQKDQNELD